MQPEGGVSRGWDIFLDNPRVEIGGRSITSEIEQETIRAVVLAYAEGRIELPFETRNPKQFRNAPSFRPAGKKFNKDKFLKPYNAESIAKFLGWMSGRAIGSEITSRLVADVDTAAGIG